MASLPLEEKIEFMLHLLATADEFKPNYAALSRRLGINTNSNAQRRLKGIVEAEKKFTLLSNGGVTRILENMSAGTTDTNVDVRASGTSKQGGKRSKLNGQETPMRKKRKIKKKAVEAAGAEEEEEDRGEGQDDEVLLFEGVVLG